MIYDCSKHGSYRLVDDPVSTIIRIKPFVRNLRFPSPPFLNATLCMLAPAEPLSLTTVDRRASPRSRRS